MLVAHRLGRELEPPLGGRVTAAAGRRGRGGRRGCLSDLRRSVEPTIEGGGRGQPGKADGRHEGGRNGQIHGTNRHLRGSHEGSETLPHPHYGPFPANVPERLYVFLKRCAAEISSTARR